MARDLVLVARPTLMLAAVLLLTAAPAPAQPGSPAGQMPPRMAEEVVEFLEWSMQTPLGARERQEVADSLRAGWARGSSGDIAGMRALHAARDSVSRMAPRDRAIVRPSLERQFVRGFRQQQNHPAARAFLPAYAARRRDAPAVPWPGDAPPAHAPVAAAPAPPRTTPREPGAPQAASGAAARVYYRTSASTGFAGQGYTLATYYLALFPNGRYYRGFFPAEGVQEFDWAFWCAREGGTCGTYELRGGAGVQSVALRGHGGREEVLQLAAAPGGSRDAFITLQPMDGLRLNATYAGNCYNNFEATLQLTADGRFSERELLGCAWAPIRGNFHTDYETFRARLDDAERNRAGSGTYTIRANTLELRYASGRVVRLGVRVDPPWTPAAGDPPQLCVAGACLERVR